MADISFQVQGDRANSYVSLDGAVQAAAELVQRDGKPRDVIRIAESVIGTVQPAVPVFVRVP